MSKDTLDEAVSLIQKIFPYRPDQKNAQRSFSDSLMSTKFDKTYWVAVNKEGIVVGVTGLYFDRNDKSVVWLGWFGVHPKHRRQGIGSELLAFTIDEAKRRGYSLLKLYTSSDENEKAARQLYKKFGFLQTASDIKSDRIYFDKDLREELMEPYEIKIEWEGPFSLNEVINKMNDGGKSPDWDGNDYGLYQIYGWHILCGGNALLYIGITTERTFSQRFNEHKVWLEKDQNEEYIKIYLGRVYDPKRHSVRDKWKSWKSDIEIAEKILIYKYSPNYNSRELTREPDISPRKSIRLVHIGVKSHRLEKEDNVPRDFFK